MTYGVDDALFRELAGSDPVAICSRALCAYDDTRRCYRLTLWGDEYAVFPFEARIERLSRNLPEPHDTFFIFIVNYLLQVRPVPLHGVWVSEKDLPGGAAFFRGPHAVPTDRAVARFGNDIKAFAKACERLGGTALDLAEAAYGFTVSPCLALAVLYWAGDEDFAPEVKLLYDRSIAHHFALDCVFALAVDVCFRLVRPV